MLKSLRPFNRSYSVVSKHSKEGSLLQTLHDKRLESKQGGGPVRIETQHKKGKLTARERLNLLLDKGSFVEYDTFVEHQCYDFNMQKQKYC